MIMVFEKKVYFRLYVIYKLFFQGNMGDNYQSPDFKMVVSQVREKVCVALTLDITKTSIAIQLTI